MDWLDEMNICKQSNSRKDVTEQMDGRFRTITINVNVNQ